MSPQGAFSLNRVTEGPWHQESDLWLPQDQLSNVCPERITCGLCNGTCDRDTQTRITVETLRRENLSASSKDWTLGTTSQGTRGDSQL